MEEVMKEKVMSLAQGNFTYEQPEIVVSPGRLEFEVPEGGEASSVFRVKNARGTKIKGFGAVDEFDIGFLPVFDLSLIHISEPTRRTQ